MADTIQLLYTSNAVREFSDEELVGLLREARKRNTTRDVTGLLIYGDEAFMQAIEGPEDQVDRLFDTIRQDPRHQDVRQIYRETIPTKQFLSWRMGFRRLRDDFCGADLFNLSRGSLERALPTCEAALNLRVFMGAFYAVAFPEDEEGLI
ncbi:MAG: BLUF domain-containing protein [Pseudomonadota bacterium]